MRQTLKVQFEQVAGAIITDITVGQAKNAKSSSGKADSLQLRALWDTGAALSAISATVAKRLDLVVVDTRPILGANGPAPSDRYDISITLPNGVNFPIIRATEWYGGKNYDVLGGMDIIHQGDFSIINDGCRTVFTFKA